MKNLPDTIKSINAYEDPAGNFIIIAFKNGAVLHVSAENDGVHYYSTNNPEARAEHPTVSMLVDMGAGLHTGRSDEATVMRGDDCIRLDVNHY